MRHHDSILSMNIKYGFNIHILVSNKFVYIIIHKQDARPETPYIWSNQFERTEMGPCFSRVGGEIKSLSLWNDDLFCLHLARVFSSVFGAMPKSDPSGAFKIKYINYWFTLFFGYTPHTIQEGFFYYRHIYDISIIDTLTSNYRITASTAGTRSFLVLDDGCINFTTNWSSNTFDSISSSSSYSRYHYSKDAKLCHSKDDYKRRLTER